MCRLHTTLHTFCKQGIHISSKDALNYCAAFIILRFQVGCICHGDVKAIDELAKFTNKYLYTLHDSVLDISFYSKYIKKKLLCKQSSTCFVQLFKHSIYLVYLRLKICHLKRKEKNLNFKLSPTSNVHSWLATI